MPYMYKCKGFTIERPKHKPNCCEQTCPGKISQDSIQQHSLDCVMSRTVYRRQEFGLEHVEKLRTFKRVTAWVNAVSWSWLRYRLGISMAITVPLVFELSLRYVFRRPVHEQTPYFSLRGAATLHVVLHQGMEIHPPSCHLSGAFRHDSTMFDPSYHYGGDGMDLDALGGIGEEYFVGLYHC